MLRKFFLSEKNMMIAIVVNALIIYLLYFPQLHHSAPAFYNFLEWLDIAFILLFVAEAAVKLNVLKPKTYFGNGWNVFDFLIVVASLPSLFHFLPGLGLINTSFVKVLRLLRMVRLIKFIRFVPNVTSMLEGLLRALKASIFVILALIFINFLFSLFTCHFFGRLLPEYFGDPLISSYYIFQLFTLEGWNEIPQAVTDAANAHGLPNAMMFAGLTRFYFIFLVLVGGIFGMSLANAIFVDEMMSDNNRELESKIDQLEGQISELSKLIKEQFVEKR